MARCQVIHENASLPNQCVHTRTCTPPLLFPLLPPFASFNVPTLIQSIVGGMERGCGDHMRGMERGCGDHMRGMERGCGDHMGGMERGVVTIWEGWRGGVVTIWEGRGWVTIWEGWRGVW